MTHTWHGDSHSVLNNFSHILQGLLKALDGIDAEVRIKMYDTYWIGGHTQVPPGSAEPTLQQLDGMLGMA